MTKNFKNTDLDKTVLDDRKTYCNHCQSQEWHRYRPSPEINEWRCSVCGEPNYMPGIFDIQWESRDYGWITGKECRPGEHELLATIYVKRGNIRNEISGYAEVSMLCYLIKEKAERSIADFIVVPRFDVLPTSTCKQCKGTCQHINSFSQHRTADQNVTCSWYETSNDSFICQSCGGTGQDIIGQAQQLVEKIWESTRHQIRKNI